MKPIYDKLQKYTDIHSFVKKCPHLVTKIIQAVLGRSPIEVKNMLTSPTSDMTRFSGKKENQSISVINYFFPDL